MRCNCIEQAGFERKSLRRAFTARILFVFSFRTETVHSNLYPRVFYFQAEDQRTETQKRIYIMRFIYIHTFGE